MKGVGLESSIPWTKLVLPIGISFYTFHGISYIFDVRNTAQEYKVISWDMESSTRQCVGRKRWCAQLFDLWTVAVKTSRHEMSSNMLGLPVVIAMDDSIVKPLTRLVGNSSSVL